MDYYSRLGVNKNASPEEIKKAYKKLAMQHHPDRGGDQKTFQEINEAYDTLRDPSRRQQYDSPQRDQRQYQYTSQNMDDIFNAFFGQRRSPRQQKNQDIKLSYTMSLEDVAVGKDIIATYTLRNGNETTATIRIHPGVRHGEAIRYKGLGDNTYYQLPRGDLVVHIRVHAHPRFDRDGKHLYTNVNVDVFDLMLGTTVSIEKLTGGYINVNIKAGTNPGTTLSVAGHGLPDISSGRQGNLYVKINAKTPTINDPELLDKIKGIKNAINKST